AMLAAEHNLHAFVEKPLAMKASEADQIVQAFRKSGKILMVGHVVRFFGEYVQARHRVLSGAIGSPVMIRTTRAGRMPRGVGNWFGNYAQSGGVILDLIVHDLDYAVWCFGAPRRVYAKSVVSDVNAVGVSLDHAFVTVKFQNGVIGHFEGSWALPDGFYTAFEVSGSGGIIQYDSRKVSPLLLSESAAEEGQKPNVFLPESPLHDCPYRSEVQHFAEVLQGKAELVVKPEDAVTCVAVAASAWWSLRTGQSVQIQGGAKS
ncbi:MAG TPA: Gfo/Idh/MocA family oxidoreductase, partial [bacterium]|nr:Gfo/Idh/MocA family oxidoreductase [bacterium]